MSALEDALGMLRLVRPEQGVRIVTAIVRLFRDGRSDEQVADALEAIPPPDAIDTEATRIAAEAKIRAYRGRKK